MDILVYIRAVAALGLVLALIWGGMWLLRRYGSGLLDQRATGADKNLKIVERLDLPHRKTLVKVQDGDRQHLLLVSATGETVVESSPIADKTDQTS